MFRDKASGEGWAPVIPKLPPPGCEGSNVEESCRESRDLDGSVDCEKGVVGDIMLAAVLDPPLELAGKCVMSCGGGWLVVLAGVGGLCMAESAM